MLVRSAQLVQALMNRPKNLETMSNHSQLEKNVPKKLEKESVLANTLLKEQKLLQRQRHQLLFSQSKHHVHKALPTLARSKELLQVNMTTAKTS